MTRLFTVLCLLAITVSVWAANEPAPAPSAAAYDQWTQSCLQGLEQDMPQITRSAEMAAARYVTDETCEIGVKGEHTFAFEGTYRSGGLIRLRKPFSDDDARLAPVKIILFALREDHLGVDAAISQEYHQAGRMVIAFGEAGVVQRYRNAGGYADSVVNTHAAPHDGLFRVADGGWMVPTVPVANTAAFWTWMGEFVGACTRQGKMPPMYQGFCVKGGFARFEKLQDLKFHPEPPQLAPAGALGRAYLQGLRANLAEIREGEMADIRRAAAMLAQANAAGHGAYAFLHGHAVFRENLQGPHRPRLLTKINDDWFHQRDDMPLQAGDAVLCLGFDMVFQGEKWGHFAERARTVGATPIWCLTSYEDHDPSTPPAAELVDPQYTTADIATIPPDEILIDQRWRVGDAVVEVPGYDVKILPTSGVVAEAILWMVTAELAGLRPRE